MRSKNYWRTIRLGWREYQEFACWGIVGLSAQAGLWVTADTWLSWIQPIACMVSALCWARAWVSRPRLKSNTGEKGGRTSIVVHLHDGSVIRPDGIVVYIAETDSAFRVDGHWSTPHQHIQSSIRDTVAALAIGDGSAIEGYLVADSPTEIH